ncbi:MAG: TerC family protein [Gemmatimonadetes bacterium]|nr:TerC family protein [Gemmatimonadota bacterium]
MPWLTDPTIWLGLLTLSALEIVLGIDNIIFISILAGALPEARRDAARKLGLAAAFFTRVLLLLSIGWLVSLTAPLLVAGSVKLSGRDLVLLVGGLFLIFKATREIHAKLEGPETEAHGAPARKVPAFSAVIVQIMLIDIVFSLDSVITAVGMVSQVSIMIAANVVALAFMLGFSGRIAAFVERHPTIKVLALSFLVMIGTNLVAEAFGVHIPKGYTYFAMAFSVGVEMVNLRVRAKAEPVHLRSQPPEI